MLKCVPDLSMSCQPLYDPPSFGALYQNILHPTCASGHGTCHTSDVKMGGLFFEDQTTSYQLLLGMIDGRARVVPGDSRCSLLLEKLQATDSSLRMPPGPEPLSTPALCTFSKWIAGGASP